MCICGNWEDCATPSATRSTWAGAMPPFAASPNYMQTPEFESGLQRLIKLARQKRSALMCAEAVPWRCHRSLIADALVVRGVRVEDIMTETRSHKFIRSLLLLVSAIIVSGASESPTLPQRYPARPIGAAQASEE